MAIGVSLLEANDDTSNDPASTASSTLDPAGDPVLAFVAVSSATTNPPASVTITTSTGTWTKLAGEVLISSTVDRSLFAYQCIGWNGASGATFNANETATAYNWCLLRITGSAATPFTTIASVGQAADTSGTDWDTAETVTATLGSTPGANDRQFSAAFLNVTTDSLAQDAQFTEISQNSVSTPSMNLHVSWSNGTSEQASSYTQSSGNNAHGGVIIVNVDAPAAGAATKVSVVVAGV